MEEKGKVIHRDPSLHAPRQKVMPGVKIVCGDFKGERESDKLISPRSATCEVLSRVCQLTASLARARRGSAKSSVV